MALLLIELLNPLGSLYFSFIYIKADNISIKPLYKLIIYIFTLNPFTFPLRLIPKKSITNIYIIGIGADS